MNHLLNISAQALSILLYPLFIPTYGMLLVCSALSVENGTILPTPVWLMLAGSTAILTLLIPLFIILIMVHRKQLDDIQIQDPKQRTLPYLCTIICYLCWCYVLAQTQLPHFLLHTAVGATGALAAVTLINTRWKISAHLTAWGGLLGGIANYCLWSCQLPTLWILIVTMLVTCLLIYARIGLKAHTLEQTVAGLLLGLTATAAYDAIYTLIIV